MTKKAAVSGKKSVDWADAEARYRHHLIDSHRIVKFHTAEVHAPVEVELERVFIKLMAQPRPIEGVSPLQPGSLGAMALADMRAGRPKLGQPSARLLIRQ